MSRSLKFPAGRLGLLVLALLALLLARQLMVVHGVAHAAGLSAAPELEWAAGHEQGDSLCQALDEMGGADAPLPPAGMSVLAQVSAEPLDLPQAQRLANGLWRASARGPPQG